MERGKERKGKRKGKGAKGKGNAKATQPSCDEPNPILSSSFLVFHSLLFTLHLDSSLFVLHLLRDED